MISVALIFYLYLGLALTECQQWRSSAHPDRWPGTRDVGLLQPETPE